MKITSIVCTDVTIPVATGEVLGNNPRRRGLIFSAGSVSYSLSWNNNCVLGKSTFNFFANVGETVTLCSCDVGTAITLPMYGIASGGAIQHQITEILIDDPTGPDW